MDTEDSPWGDVPSRSSSNANLNQAVEAQETEQSKPKSTPAKLSASSADVPKSPAAREPRTPRTPRRIELQSTKLEALDDAVDPLGPLGADASSQDLGPVPPTKEQPLQSSSQLRKSIPGRSELDEDPPQISRTRGPPPVQPMVAGIDGIRRQSQPSISLEQASKPSFDITVGDPHKVGDLTNSHIVYNVRTKTTSKAYKNSEFTATRRYRDFLWLYNQLHSNNPGVVVPPPPEKQAVGRFDTNFVESRRAALEKMLNKTAAHSILQHDSDLKLFLESEAFASDVKHREHREPLQNESKGMFSSFGLGNNTGGKFIEHDDWFHDRKIYLDALENQLKALLKAIDTVVSQRKFLAEAVGEFSAALHALAIVELSPNLSGPLEGLSDLQLRIKELYERQAQTDVLTLGITIDEYIRTIASIKQAFQQRQKAYQAWHSAESELARRKTNQDKVLRSGKTQQDRLNQLQADVGEGERKYHQSRLLYEDMGQLMRTELERFEKEKVEDFKSGVETFLEGQVEAQKELIELWETFLMQLDADKEDQPFFKPQVLQTEPLVPRTVSTSNESTTEINNPARSGQDFTEGGEQDLQSSVNSSKNDTGAHDVAATVAEATINAEQAE